MRKAMNIICGILAELCALAVIFLGAYLAYDAKASSLDQSYVSHRQEQVSHRKIHKATPGKTATMRHTDRHPPRMRHAPYPAACRLAGHGPVLERHVGTRPWIRFGTDSRTPRGHTPHIPDGVPSDRRRAPAARRMEPHSHGSVAS